LNASSLFSPGLVDEFERDRIFGFILFLIFSGFGGEGGAFVFWDDESDICLLHCVVCVVLGGKSS